MCPVEEQSHIEQCIAFYPYRASVDVWDIHLVWTVVGVLTAALCHICPLPAVIKDFCKQLGVDNKQVQGVIRLAKKNGEKLGFLA
jgi:hypothetical protein